MQQIMKIFTEHDDPYTATLIIDVINEEPSNTILNTSISIRYHSIIDFLKHDWILISAPITINSFGRKTYQWWFRKFY